MPVRRVISRSERRVRYYKDLLRRLQRERVEAGGTLPEAREISYVRRLEAAWERLTTEQQDRILDDVYG